ncbi:hypothetical protein C0J52_14058 [Blattella germanica]|nr:hypothetical protein C0J52_14058 [Blattella germanica]
MSAVLQVLRLGLPLQPLPPFRKRDESLPHAPVRNHNLSPGEQRFWLVMEYLSEMTDEMTLVMYSGHPLGLFPSHPGAPRAVVTNGMVIPNYSSRQHYDNMFALGVTMYGQMTAGSYCYIGPQGIVHGTTITVLNAGRKYLGTKDLAGKVFVTSGLGGMSGAQAKAAVIAGCIGVIAEVSEEALRKRHNQGWLMELESDLDKIIERIRSAKKERKKSYNYYFSRKPDRLQIMPIALKELQLKWSGRSAHLQDGNGVPTIVETQYRDNLLWIQEAGKHKLVVGSQARILYSDRIGRIRLALAFNNAIKNGVLKGPVVISRDHHDVSGTDSPYRETSNIEDGSAFTADMAVQNCIGDSFRGATWVSIHNGGGVGWGEVINGGFGLLLDGTEEAARRANLMLSWDTSNGVARRSVGLYNVLCTDILSGICWSGNKNAMLATQRAMQDDPLIRVTLPHQVEDHELIGTLFK